MRPSLITALLVVAAICAQAQNRDIVVQAPAPSAPPARGYSGGAPAATQHHDAPVVVRGGTGIQDRFDFRVQERNLRVFGSTGTVGGRVGNRGTWGRFRGCPYGYCNPGSGYFYNPYYALPVYIERNNGPDFNNQPSAYQVYGGEIPKEYMAPGAAAVDAAYRQGQLDQRITSLAEQVARLRAEKAERDAQQARLAQSPAPSKPDRSFADAGTADAKDPAQGPSAAATATLVFKNGTRLDIANYGVVGQTLWVFDEQRARKISLDDLDLEATKKVNAANGFDFKLPRK